MKKLYVFLFIGIFSFYFGQIKKDLCYQFYENKGQIVDQNGKENSAVKYLFTSGGLNVQIKNTGFSYDVYEVKKTLKKQVDKNKEDFLIKDKTTPQYDLKYNYHRIEINFVGANKNPEIIAVGKSEDYENYYNIPSKPNGVEKVHRYQKLIYKNLYPNIDLAFFKPEDTLKPIEYNFIVNPSGKISDIRLKFKGAKTKLKDGKLAMNLRFGEMQENIPNSWIEDKNSKTDIKVIFKQTGDQEFGFESSQDVFYKTVVIDPVPTRIWGSYFGNHYDNESTFIVSDANSNVYFGGKTSGTSNIATIGSFQPTASNGGTYDNGFVEKFNEKGQRIWGTYIGNLTYQTNVYDGILSSDAIYIGGSTFDHDGSVNSITTPGIHKQFASPNSREAFILKLDLNGQRIWGTYYGGKGYEDIYDLDFDQQGNILASGITDSPDGIATIDGFISTKPESYPGFFSKFSPDGQLLYGSYFYRPVDHITSDLQNHIIIAGQYYNLPEAYPNIGTAGTHQPTIMGYNNGFILKFNTDYSKMWGTYYGGSDNTGTNEETNKIAAIIVDKNNDIVIAGTTKSTDLIGTPGAFKEFKNNATENGFIAKFQPDGKIKWSTYYGTDGYFGNRIKDLSLNANGDIYVAGDTRSRADIVTNNAYQTTPKASDDGYFAKFSSNGYQIWGTYYSDNYSDYLQRISVRDNFIYVIGYTSGSEYSSPFGTAGVFESAGHAGYYLGKFQDCQNNVSISPNQIVCPGSDIKLEASGGTSYSWTGPNGYISDKQNPTIHGAKSINSGTYFCQISGTGDCDGTYTVNVKVEDKTAPVPDIANLPDISGDCKTAVSIIPTATDACAGTINATPKTPLQYSDPGIYIIIWEYNDGNGNTFPQTQKLIISSPSLPAGILTQEFCSTENPTVEDLQITGQNIKWYDSAGTILDSSTKLINGNYYVTQTINGCDSNKLEIVVKINVTPLPTGDANQNFCTSQNAKISDLKVIGIDPKFYDSAGDLLLNSTLLLDNNSYFVTQTINSCESEKFEIKVVISQNSLPATDYPLSICNDTTSSTKTEDLTNYEEKLIQNSPTYIFDYFDESQVPITDFKNRKLSLGENIFNVKISTPQGCFKTVQLTLQLNAKPKINLPKTAEFCTGKSVELDAGFNPDYSYLWSSGEKTNKISVNKEGNYIVTVTTNFGCENTASTIVKKSLIAEILKVEITNNNAKIILSASGDFEYSLDNLKWQDFNQFKNLANGNYTVYVRTKLGCMIGEKEFSIFNITNSFTPNGDRKNDYWKIDGLENYPNSEVSVYDNQGKRVLFKITSGVFEWDGKLNSRVLPTATYWYNIKVSDGRILNGYLLLKNRN